ncbi:MAG: hypothetical protein AAFN51_08520, partial [Pseudomonadota bacterium]
MMNAVHVGRDQHLPYDRIQPDRQTQVLVTPDMHRVHHSVHRDEHDSNYGFALSIWDRM